MSGWERRLGLIVLDTSIPTHALLDSLTWIDVDETIGEQAGKLARRFRASHRGVGVVVYVIAATSIHLHGELWTRNIKHFPMFSDLKSPY